MSPERQSRLDQPAIQQAIGKLQGAIRARYPAAAFAVAEGEDPEGVYLHATVETDDLTAVLETVAEPLFHIQVEQELPLYIVPTRPLARVLEGLRAQPRDPARPVQVDLAERLGRV